jgi:hypothetical protein
MMQKGKNKYDDDAYMDKKKPPQGCGFFFYE